MEPQFSKSHLSYKKHRRQFWLQIFLPMLITILIIIAIAIWTGRAAFVNSGEAPVWAAISTIWLIFPMMIFGLIFLAVLVGLIYLLARALDFVPPYTAKSQYHVNRGSDLAKRYSNIAVRPILFIEGITASLKTLFGKK